MARLLSWVDKGKLLQHEYAGPEVVDMREWVELFRRLQVEYYEEARQNWESARTNGRIDPNPYFTYSPGNLQSIVEDNK